MATVTSKGEPLHRSAEVAALKAPLHCGPKLSLCCCHRCAGTVADHRHDQLEIDLLFEPAACALSWQSGRGTREEKTFKGPAVLIIAPQRWHACRWESDADVIVLYLERAFHRRLLPQGLGAITSSVPMPSQDMLLWQSAAVLRKQCLARNPAKTSVVHLLAEALATRAIELLAFDAAESEPQLAANLVQQVIEFIDSHIGFDIGVNDLAKRAGYSVPHFSALFKQATGQTPAEFLFCRRMAKGDELLRTGNYHMREVAELVGYLDPAHFATRFTEHFGYAPKHAMQQGRAESSIRPLKS